MTRLARTLEGKEIELQVARALERRNGLGDAANLSLTFDRDPGDVRLDAGFTGAMQADHRALRQPQRPLRRHLRNRQRERRRRDQAALHRHGDRDRRSRGAGAQCRAQRDPEIIRRDGRAPPESGSRRGCRRARPRGRHAGPPPAPRRPGDQDRRSRQARSGAARPERHADLRGARNLPHHARQGAGERHRRRRRQRHEPAVEAHAVRHRDRPRPGFDHARCRLAPPQTSDATSSLGAPQAAPVAVATVSSPVAPKAE